MHKRSVVICRHFCKQFTSSWLEAQAFNRPPSFETSFQVVRSRFRAAVKCWRTGSTTTQTFWLGSPSVWLQSWWVIKTTLTLTRLQGHVICALIKALRSLFKGFLFLFQLFGVVCACCLSRRLSQNQRHGYQYVWAFTVLPTLPFNMKTPSLLITLHTSTHHGLTVDPHMCIFP